VYRRRLEPCSDPIIFGVYVSYFPQLVAGPIERAQNLLPQFSKPRRVDSDMFASGCVLILIGLLRKMVIADGVAPYVDQAFADPAGMSSLMLLRAVALFSLQIYGDFAGYTDIARGVSRLFGIDLMVNFNHPYFATSITTFWRRWHISLSTWLRDYLYIPLGGNRGPKWFVYRNLMLTMLLGGLWHGAAWTFVIWGGIHGIALAVHKLIGPRETFHPVRAVGGWIITMFVVAIAWVFFRAPDFATAFEVLSGIASLRGDWTAYHLRPLVYVVVLMLCIDVPQAIAREHTITMKWPALVRGFSYAMMLLVLVVYGSRADVPFIYFQF
jgi:D-alanyl-lipoteichoic acid acyltransferase DltB (MBOAT superfamily)